jgi:uncharacterized protein YjdB
VGAGGFGGGGGANARCTIVGGGGGGGYSGGGAGAENGSGPYAAGGGGGSLNTGTLQTNSVGNTGNGSVSITPLGNCVTPYVQPSSLSFGATLFTLNGSFANAVPTPLGYLVLMSSTSTPPANPADGTTYAIGDSSLGAKVISNNNSTTFAVSGLNPGTTRYFWVYSYNGLCSGAPKYLTTSPLTGSGATTNCALSGTKTVGPSGDYPTLASAFTACSNLGVAGPLTLELQTSYTGETYPINIGSYPCLSATNNIKIRPQGTMAITASTPGALISMNGARYVTIDGRSSSGTPNALTLINTNTSNPVVQFINDAQYNTIKNLNIRSANQSTSTTNMGAIFVGTTSGTYGNDYNTIDSCDIASTSSGTLLTIGIFSNGTTNKENGFNTISNCNIYDYYHTGYYNYGIWLNANNNDWNIARNKFYQTSARSYFSSWYTGGIYVSPGSTGNSSGFNIRNNTIGYATNSGTGLYTASTSGSDYFRFIWTNVGIVSPTIIKGNTITAINITGSFNTASPNTGNSSGITGVFHQVGSANIDSNTIGATTGNGTISVNMSTSIGGFAGIVNSASNPSIVTPAVVNITNNKIGAVTVNASFTSYSPSIWGIFTCNNNSVVVSGNTIGSTTTSNSLYIPNVNTSGNTNLYGVMCQNTLSLVTPPVISNNTIANLTSLGTSPSNLMAGIVHTSSTATVNISANTIYNLSSATSNSAYSTQMGVAGIICTPTNTTPAPTATVAQNTIYNIANTNPGANYTHVVGILYSGATEGTITRNKIYGLANASTNSSSTTSPPTATGIFVYAPGGSAANSTTITNNMVTLGTGQATNTSFTGIMQGGTTPSSYVRVYHNSVLIEGSAASGSNLTAAFNRGGYNTTTSTQMDIRNNIFINNRTNSSGSAKHYAIANGIPFFASTTGFFGASSDYNILNATNSATVGWYNGADQTLAGWKAVTTGDNNSATGAAITFLNPSSGDLHINMGATANMLESHGITLPSLTNDYDNGARPGPVGSVNGGGFAPDLGADEFDGNPIDNIPPAITYAVLPNACGTGDRTFTATLADPAGIPTSGTLRPRVYYKKSSGGIWYSSPATLSSGTSTNGVWAFTIVATDMGGLALTDIVQYFVVAQDNNGIVGSNTSGVAAANVNTITTSPSTPPNYTVLLNLGGSYNIGAGGDYATITAAANAYNSACLSGPVTFNLISPTYPSESFPIQINRNAFASATNTLTIKPSEGTAVTINGPSTVSAIFKLLNAKWVTFDGVNTGGASVTLNSNYTSTFANVWLASSSSVGPGCRNITIKNLNIKGGANTSTNYGILAGLDNGSTPTTSGGMDNDSITITGNNFSKLYYAVFASGTAAISTGGLNKWNINNNTFGPSAYSATDNIGVRGIYATNMLDLDISDNLFRNIGINTFNTQVAAIYFASNVNGATITRNTIKQITSNNSSNTTSGDCGIYLGSSVANALVTRNIITDMNSAYASCGGVSYGILIASGLVASNITVANNMISNIRAKGCTSNSNYSAGIYLSSTSTGTVRIYYNSVNLYGNYNGYNGTTGSACFLNMSSSNNVDVRNNIFRNSFDNTTVITDKNYAIYTNQSTGATFSYLDNNDYSVSSTNFLGFLSADKTDLVSLRSAFGGNLSSITALPVFVDTTDLHLQVTPENLPFVSGVPVSVPRDYDDTVRSTITPVIGAHEVKIPPCNTVPINAGTPTPINPSLCTQGTSTILPIGATSALGLTYQWLSSIDSTSWSAISGATTRSYIVSPPITGTTFYRLRIGCSTSGVYDSAVTKIVVTPSRIQGAAVVCEGLTTTLEDTTTGGTWISSATSIATIGSSTGILTGIAFGTTTVTYRVTSSGCYATKVATVNPLPANIFGVASVCQGASTTLVNVSAGGTWSSDAPAIATIGASGIVSGLTAGIAGITYTLPTGCLKSVQASVNPLPVLSIMPSSSANICFGETAPFKANAYLPQFSLLHQDFNGGLGLWQIANVAGTPGSYWQLYPTGYGGGGIAGDGSPMVAAAPIETGGISTNTTLISPSFSTVGYGSATLTFNEFIISDASYDMQAQVEYSTNGGSSWNLLHDELNTINGGSSWSASSPDVAVPLPAGALGHPDVKLRWVYNSNFGFWWAVDNIKVKAALPDPTYAWNAIGTATGLPCTSCDSTNITPAVAGVNLYSVTATTASGCASTGGLTWVLVNPQPAVISGTLQVCENGTTTLANAVTGGAWSSADVSIANVNSLTGVVTGVAAGTVNITYSLATGCNVTTTITVNPTPAPITGALNVCAGFTASLNSATPGGTWSSGATSVGTVDASGIVTGIVPGTAPISYTLASTGCFVHADVAVNPYPAMITASSFGVCEGMALNLSNVSIGGAWSTSDGAIASVFTGSGIVTGGTAGTATITYTLPAGCYRTQEVTVNPTPAAITSPSFEVCQFSAIALDDVTAGGTWASGSPTIASVGPTTGILLGGVNAGVAAVTYTLPTGCFISTNITVNPLPAPISGLLQVCEGAATLLGNTTPGGTWFSANTSVAPIGTASGVAVGNGAGTTNITYTMAVTGCSRSVVLTVNQSPSPISGTLSVCENSMTTLGNAVAGGAWASSTPAVAGINSSGGVAGVSYGTTTISYTLPIGGCSKVAVVTVNQLPAVISGTRQVCIGYTTTLGNAAAGGMWSTSDASVATISASGVVSGIAAGTASIKYEMPTGCSMFATVTVNSLPAAISGINQVCVGNTTTLGNASTGGTWASSNVTVAAINPASGSVNGIVAGTSTITYSLPTGCIATIGVTVNSLPAPITGNFKVCQGLVTTLSSASTGGTWASNTTAVATVDGSGVVTGNLSGTTIITHQLPTGCSSSVVVTVNQLPATIAGATNVCQGNTVTLTNLTPGGAWASGVTSVATITASSGILSGIAAGNAPVTYTLPTGCKTTTVLAVDPLPAIITGTLKVCEGMATTLSTTTVGGTWGSSIPGVATIDAAGIVYGVSPGSSNIVYTSSQGCARTVQVVVNPLPAAISGAMQVCKGSSTVLSNTIIGGAWSSSTPAVASVGLMSGIVNGTAPGVAIISYTLLTGCYQTAAVTVNALPAAISGALQVCPGLATSLSSATPGGNWSSSTAGIATIASASGIVSGVAAGTATIAYTLSSTGCTAVATLTVNPLPLVRNVTGGGSYCAGGTGVNIGIDGSTAGVGYQLYNGSSLVGTVAGTGSALDFGPQAAAGIYSVYALNPSSTCANNMAGAASINIIPLATPTATIITAVGDTVCEGATTAFNALVTGEGLSPTYSWKVNGASVAATGTSYSYVPANGDVVSVTMASSSACVVPAAITANFVINVKPNMVPVVNLTSFPGNTVCKGSSVTFNAAAVYGGTAPTYNWYVNGAWAASGSSFGYIPANGDIVNCRLLSNYACLLVDSVTSANQNMVTNSVYVPVVNIAVTPGTTVGSGENATFAATAIGAGPTPAYQWYIKGIAQPGATNASFTSNNFATGDSVTCKVEGSGPCGHATFNSVVMSVAPLGIAGMASGDANVRLMPNPNRGAFNVVGTLANSTDQEATIEVINMLGQKVYTNTVIVKGGNLNEQVKLGSTLANGMYLLNLSAGIETKVFHFVLEQ